MPDLLLIDAVGTCIAIDTTDLDADDATAITAAWADATVPPDAGVEPAQTITPRGGTRAQMLSTLSQQVTLAAIERRKGELWMLHAAAVVTDDGAVVVLVGPSGRGKTTAARALGRHFGYLSDETVAIDADGRVWPYRKPLSVIEDAGSPKSQLAPSQLGLRPVPDAPLRVAAIALLDREPDGPDQPELETLETGDALAELVAQSSHLSRMGAPLRQIAAHAAATGGIRRVRYREAETLPGVIPALASGRLADPAKAEPAPEPTETATAPPADPQVARFTRARAVDILELTDPERVALLTVDRSDRGTVRVLAGIAPTVWRAAAGVTLAELTDAAVAAYGTPEGSDAAAGVLAAVVELLEAGVLRSDQPVLRRRADAAGDDPGDRVAALAAAADAAPDVDDVADRFAAAPGPSDPTDTARATARLVWEWLAEPLTATQLIARAVAETGAPVTEADRDVRGALAVLQIGGLVEPMPDPA